MKRLLLFLIVVAGCLHAQTIAHISHCGAGDNNCFPFAVTSTTAGNAQILLTNPENQPFTLSDNKGQSWPSPQCSSESGIVTGGAGGDAYSCFTVICSGAGGVTSISLDGGSYEGLVQMVFFEVSGLPSSSCTSAFNQAVGTSAPSAVSVTPTASHGLAIVGFTCYGDAINLNGSSVTFSNVLDIGGDPVGTYLYTTNTAITAETDSGSNACNNPSTPKGWGSAILTLNAAGPIFSYSPSPVAFGSVSVGNNSFLTVTISNPGSSALDIGSLSSGSGAYVISSDTCSSEDIAGGTMCTFTLTFTPTVAGAQNTTVTVPDNVGNPDTINVTGTGVTVSSTKSVGTAGVLPSELGIK